MSGLDNLRTRLLYNGGENQESRMQLDKLRSLKKSLLYSYQAATAVLEDKRAFRCLINPDKTKVSSDDKIISIPYEDICLGIYNEETDLIEKKIPNDKTSKSEEVIGMKPGDVFLWRDTNTYWLVYIERLEEDAYFRAEIRRCDQEIEINGNPYKVYVRGPEPADILWHTKKGLSWNELNYDAIMYITKNEETEDYLHRFSEIKINGKPWEVQMVDSLTTIGIIEVGLKETYQNSIKDKAEEEKKKEELENPINPEPDEENPQPHITGDAIVYPYDKKEYIIEGLEGGYWELSNNKAIITKQTELQVAIEITTSRSGNIDLIYKKENEDDIIYHITIKSL